MRVVGATYATVITRDSAVSSPMTVQCLTHDSVRFHLYLLYNANDCKCKKVFSYGAF